MILNMVRKSRHELGKSARDELRVLESIRRVRAQDYATGGLWADHGIWSVAVPLPPASNGLVLVVGVSALDQPIEKSSEIAAMIRAKIALHVGAVNR